MPRAEPLLEPAAASPPSSPAVLRLCCLLLGVSAFPVTETLLLQTVLFSSCFLWGDRFYYCATLALFLPGFAVQLVQHRRDAEIEHLVSSRRFGLLRLLFGHSLQLAVLALFFWLLWDAPETWAGNDVFLGLSLVVVGVCCAIVYGTCAQTVSLFPSEYHPFFFVGTYSVSWMIAPLNVATGELCDTHSGGARWQSVVLYYSAGAVFQLLGLAAFVVVAWCTHEGFDAFTDRDLQHAGKYAATPRTPRRRKAGAPLPIRDSQILRVPATATDSDARPQTLREIWRKCGWVGGAMVLSLVQNILICGLFQELRVQGQIPSLRTLMFYAFYVRPKTLLGRAPASLADRWRGHPRARPQISQCCGTLLVMLPAVKRCLTATALMAIAVVRLPLLVLIFVYNHQSSGSLIFGSDWEVAGLYSLYMLLGGVVFSQAFSLASELFDRADDRAVAATCMNVLYCECRNGLPRLHASIPR